MPAVNQTCFQCGDGRCIFPRYKCDNFRDCRDGSDEDVQICGGDPCQGRIICGNGRCISKSSCCHRPSSTIDDQYDCDIWQTRLCCSPSPESSFKFGQRRLDNAEGIANEILDGSLTKSASEKNSSPSSINSLFATGGCTLSVGGLLLLAICFGVRYFWRKWRRERQRTNDNATRIVRHSDRCRYRQNRLINSQNRSVPQHRAIVGNPLVDPSLRVQRPNLENGELLIRMYFNSDQTLWDQAINNRYFSDSGNGHILPSVHYRSRRDQGSTVAGETTESPPPSYSDLVSTSIEPPPDYANLSNDPDRDQSIIDDGLPAYDSALNLRKGSDIDHAK